MATRSQLLTFNSEGAATTGTHRDTYAPTHTHTHTPQTHIKRTCYANLSAPMV